MKKNKGISKTSKIILLLTVIISLVTGLGAYTYLNEQNVTIYLYSGSFDNGIKITGDMFVSSSISTELYNAMAGTGIKYASADEIASYIDSGDRLLVNVAMYTPVMTNQFIAAGGTSVENRLASNMVSVELPISSVGGLSAEIRVGSKLNIMTGYAIDNTKETDLIFQNLLVVEKVMDANGELYAIYVEVDPAESIKLTHAIAFEKVTASIVKPNSYIPVNSNERSFSRSYTADMSRLEPSEINAVEPD